MLANSFMEEFVPTVLTQQQKKQFHRDGFLILEKFISDDICEFLMQRAHQLIQDFQPDDIKTIFSTTSLNHAKHQYFLDSAENIHFFFEEGAIDANGQLKVEKILSINKIGHALHDIDPVFNCFSRQHKIATLVNDLQMPDPLLAQSMYICKQPFIGGEVSCHQDATYFYIKEEPVLGLWFALEDATIENGCMWAIPGAHQGALKSRWIRDVHGQMTTTIYDDSPWPTENMTPLEVPKGTLIVLHGLLPHLSKENVSAKSRHAYTLHIISGKYHYAKDNWLQRKKPFRGFL